jgi:hypothetical protein
MTMEISMAAFYFLIISSLKKAFKKLLGILILSRNIIQMEKQIS